MTVLFCIFHSDEMSSRERESKNSQLVDIGSFVDKYDRLIQLLTPTNAIFDAILYIGR